MFGGLGFWLEWFDWVCEKNVDESVKVVRFSHECMYVHKQTCLQACVHLHMHNRISCVCVCVNVYMYTHALTQTRTCTRRMIPGPEHAHKYLCCCFHCAKGESKNHTLIFVKSNIIHILHPFYACKFARLAFLTRAVSIACLLVLYLLAILYGYI